MPNDMIKKLETLSKWIDSCPNVELSYAIERLKEYRQGLFSYSKFKVGDIVKLAKTPTITDTENWGWIGCKKYLIKNALAKVVDVDYYKGHFRYDLEFIDLETNQFTFYEDDLEIYNNGNQKSA